MTAVECVMPFQGSSQFLVPSVPVHAYKRASIRHALQKASTDSHHQDQARAWPMGSLWKLSKCMPVLFSDHIECVCYDEQMKGLARVARHELTAEGSQGLQGVRLSPRLWLVDARETFSIGIKNCNKLYHRL
eukprot:scaffold142692_cov15-Tisochrysis_lutea.AAC.1